MIICIADKNGLVHIAEFSTPNKYWSVCGKSISKSENTNTFAADAPIKTGCSNCHSYYDKVYVEDLNLSPREVRGTLSTYLDELYGWIQADVLIPEFKYSSYMSRNSRAIDKLQQRCISRINKHVPNTKRR